MNPLLNKKKLFFAALLVLIGGAAFLGRSYFPGGNFFLAPTDGSLNIVLSTDATDLSPYALDLNNRLRTANVYEGLLAFDKNLKIIPALAVSWGNVSPTVWEFKLRRGVVFHDQKAFTSQDVVDSFERAKREGGAEINGILKGVDRFDIIDSETLHIQTKTPDPLFLSKLTSFVITHPEQVGTGPYVMGEWIKGDRLPLTEFKDYWGQAPAFKSVDYRVTENKWERSDDFKKNKTDLLVAVPKDEAVSLGDRIKQSYSLEVSFLMFNLQDPLFQDRTLREKIRTLYDPAQIEAIGNHFVRRVPEFIAPGVFGYNNSIQISPFDPQKQAKDLFEGKRKKVILDYVSTYETLSQYLGQELRNAGFAVTMHPLPPLDLLERVRSNQSQLFVMGWQAENGDAGDFLDAFIHSAGEFNHGRYKNDEVDHLIEQSRTEIDSQKRLKLLQDIMMRVDQDLIGIPLFESTRLYAVRSGIQWEPRVDGLVLAKEVVVQ